MLKKHWYSDISAKEAKALLLKWREDNIRCPEKVRDLWNNCLDSGKSFGDEKWPVIEQVCIAAIDLHDNNIIKECFMALDKKFPDSTRVRYLRAMANLERRERFDDATKAYDKMIKLNEADSNSYKRKIAILIAQSRTADAVRELTEYLKKFTNDTEAWLQLSDLYISEQEYSKAAFCIEEIILTNPHNYLYFQRYAEIQYTINTAESIELARSYYAQTLKLNPNSLRALYGLYLTTVALSNQAKMSSQKKKENTKIGLWAQSKIKAMYHRSKEDYLPTIESMMTNLQL